jgi:ankyrin repeat protein
VCGVAVALVGAGCFQTIATPFLLAAAVGDVAAMRTLIAAGADPIRGTEEGTTPVMVAAGMGTDHPSRLSGQQKAAFLEAVKLAFAEGGDVNVLTLGDRTALHGAALYRLTDVVRFLVQNGADLEGPGYLWAKRHEHRPGGPERPCLSAPQGLQQRCQVPESPRRPHQPTVDLLLELGAAPYESTGRNIKVF